MFGLFARVGRLFKGFVSLFITGIEEQNPEALFEAAKQDFRERMVQYNQALARLAGIIERLKMQINTKTSKAKILEQRIMTNYKAGNNELAGSFARELQELKADLENDSQELKDTQTAYDANLRNAKIAQKEFEDKVHKLERQLNQLKVKEAQSEAAAAISGVAFKIGDTGDTLKGVQEILDKKYEIAAGKARVAQDMTDIDRVKEKEAERQAMEQTALADFLAQQGVQIEKPLSSSNEPLKKEIGPQQKETQSETK